jgi:hypothetical protein
MLQIKMAHWTFLKRYIGKTPKNSIPGPPSFRICVLKPTAGLGKGPSTSWLGLSSLSLKLSSLQSWAPLHKTQVPIVVVPKITVTPLMWLGRSHKEWVKARPLAHQQFGCIVTRQRRKHRQATLSVAVTFASHISKIIWVFKMEIPSKLNQSVFAELPFLCCLFKQTVTKLRR